MQPAEVVSIVLDAETVTILGKVIEVRRILGAGGAAGA